MIIKAQGSQQETFALTQDIYSHNLAGQLFSFPAGILQIAGGWDVLIKRARLVVLGLRFPRRSIDDTGATILKVGNDVDGVGAQQFTIVDLEEWTDINQIVSAPANDADYQLEVIATPNPQDVFIDSRGMATIYDGQPILAELQLDIEAKTL